LRFYAETADTRDYGYYAAALAWTGDPKKMNGGGPIWAIFDSDAVTREKWQVKPPYVDPPVTSSAPIQSRNWQRGSSTNISGARCRLMHCAGPWTATIPSWTQARTRISKTEAAYKLAKPPFYAAWHTPALHDSYTGIRINTTGQVLDLRGKIIPGLYACGDSAGGFGQHGICRAATYARLGAWHAAEQQV